MRRYLQDRPRNDSLRILDCGCGPGFLLRFLEHWFPGASVIGLDVDRELLQYARGRAARAGFVRASASGAFLPVAATTCDVLFALQVLEHLESPEQLISEARRVLRPDGLLIIATPNPDGFGARVMKDRWYGWRPDHVSLHPPRHWRTLLEAHGFRITRQGTTGLSGIPVFRRLPIGLLNWIPLLLFGFFPWERGEAYICLAKLRQP